MEEILKQKAKEAIDSYSDELYGLSKRIWQKPELNFQEKYAHDQLTEYLAARGFDVTPHYTLDTAFRAETGEDGGLTVGLICEYDALPEVGHACGHNLIAESGVAAAVGISVDLMNRIVRPSFSSLGSNRPFLGFLTFDWYQLSKICLRGFKERLKIRNDAKFERDLLKTNTDIVPQTL